MELLLPVNYTTVYSKKKTLGELKTVMYSNHLFVIVNGKSLHVTLLGLVIISMKYPLKLMNMPVMIYGNTLLMNIMLVYSLNIVIKTKTVSSPFVKSMTVSSKSKTCTDLTTVQNSVTFIVKIHSIVQNAQMLGIVTCYTKKLMK
jgi:hypothetical protein